MFDVVYEPGFHRIHLKEIDGQSWFTVLVPLNARGEIEMLGPRPFLFKSNWDGDEHYGELGDMTEKNKKLLLELKWVTCDPDKSVTDLLTVPIRLGRTVRFWDDDVADERFKEFTVANIQRV